jgi:hypothetical protein
MACMCFIFVGAEQNRKGTDKNKEHLKRGNKFDRHVPLDFFRKVVLVFQVA